MEILDLPYFPFPRIIEGRRVAGYNFTWARQCEGCDRQCESDRSKGLSTCSYGVNYQRVSEKQIVFGFLLPGASATLAQKKALRQNPTNRISRAELDKAVGLLRSAQKSFDEEIGRMQREIME